MSFIFRGLTAEERKEIRKDKNRERMSKIRRSKASSQGSSTQSIERTKPEM